MRVSRDPGNQSLVTTVILPMMTPRVLAAALALTVFAACSGAGKPEAQPATTVRHSTAAARAPTTPTTSAGDEKVDRYNPTHDRATCVRLLPNGQVVIVKILLVPGQPNPAYANGAKCG